MPLTERAMDVIALGLNDQQHGEEDKLFSADPHMLAAYCFDLTRKLHYMYMALRLESGRWSPSFDRYGVDDLRSLAAKIDEETTLVERAAETEARQNPKAWNRARDWEVRARALEEIIKRQYTAIKSDYAELYDAVLNKEPPRHFPPPESVGSKGS